MERIILHTDRLIIRQITISDFEAMAAICGNAELMKYVGDGNPLSEEQILKWIDITILNYTKRGYGTYAVILKTNNEFIGYCGLIFSNEISSVELIYVLKKDYWNMGLATEASKAVIDFGFNNLGLETIYASIDPVNMESQKVLTKVGFTECFEKNDEFGLLTKYFIIGKPKT